MVSNDAAFAATAATTPGVRAWAALLRVHAALVPELDRQLQAATGLPLAWYDVLLELNGAPERRLLMTELGSRAVLSRTRVSRVVEELTRVGLVERMAHPTDRRSTYAAITAACRRRFRAAAPVYLGAIAERFARHLSAAELRAVAAALERVLEAEQT
jgi:DNA-binding MarR family transcriptional regulator